MATALTPLLGLGATATVRSSSFLGNTGQDWDILGILGRLWETLEHNESDTGEDWDILGNTGKAGGESGLAGMDCGGTVGHIGTYLE